MLQPKKSSGSAGGSSGRLPSRGAVLGIDVGWSKSRRTTGLCLLEWNEREVGWWFEKAKADEGNRDRRERLSCLVGKRKLLAVGIDGPLRQGLGVNVKKYRAAEAILSRGEFKARCRPGPTNSGKGPCLHLHATKLAKLAVGTQDVANATWRHKIHDKRLVEAFPDAFLAVLHPERGFPPKNRRWVDTLFPKVSRQLSRLLDALLPGHEPICDLRRVGDHEHIAAFACALTALCAAKNCCVAVGGRSSGYIVLPPLEHWGASTTRGRRWAEESLRENWERWKDEFEEAQIWTNGRLWLPRS